MLPRDASLSDSESIFSSLVLNLSWTGWPNWNIFYRPSERLMHLGIIRAQSRVLLKPLGTIMHWCTEASKRALDLAPMMPRGISFHLSFIFFAVIASSLQRFQTGSVSGRQTWKTTPIIRVAVRETSIFRHNLDQLRALLKPLGPSQHNHIDGFKWGLQIRPKSNEGCQCLMQVFAVRPGCVLVYNYICMSKMTAKLLFIVETCRLLQRYTIFTTHSNYWITSIGNCEYIVNTIRWPTRWPNG